MTKSSILTKNRRLAKTDEKKKLWKKWGHYLAERQWETVRKERLFWLTGNAESHRKSHGKDVKKDYYYLLDSAPTHSCIKMLTNMPTMTGWTGFTAKLIDQCNT